MRIGILSDTHGSLHYFNKAMSIIGDYDYLIHCGDVLPQGSRNQEDANAVQILADKLASMPNVYYALGNGDFISKNYMPTACFEKELVLRLLHPIEVGGEVHDARRVRVAKLHAAAG